MLVSEGGLAPDSLGSSPAHLIVYKVEPPVCVGVSSVPSYKQTHLPGNYEAWLRSGRMPQLVALRRRCAAWMAHCEIE
jgi:hypothetical protein